ncbi:hypothetical protein [Pseudomonas sp. O230]|uniref:hypothetical protein n=1 Tax=Pseudomonas sp. O230 TaxID=3159450 RepID=UPI00387A9175
MDDEFYLQDSRGNTGDGLMFWAQGGGYTTNLDRAEVRTLASAVGQHKSRETDVPWPKSYIDARAHTGVDCQYVMPEEAAGATEGETRFFAAYHREWNGNDLVFLSREGGRTSNLLLAKTFSVGHVAGLAARGYQPLPLAYITAKARRLVHAGEVSIKEALRGTGIKLVKPKKPRKEVFNCDGCGRFISDLQRYQQDCRNCGANNAP